MIKITDIWASNDEDLAEALNALEGRIISCESAGDSSFRVIYEV